MILHCYNTKPEKIGFWFVKFQDITSVGNQQRQ